MSTQTFLSTQHDPWLVAASLFVACFASFVALDLARRMHREPDSRRFWWAGGSIAMGTGIWAMHFVGMLGFQAGIPLGYRGVPTLLSWCAAVAAAGVSLHIAARDQLEVRTVAAGSTMMAAGICTMHYLGMGAVALSPGIVWDPMLVTASVLIAWAASAAALLLFVLLRRLHGARRRRMQLAASVVMGAAIGGMHYTAMAAVNLPLGTVCLSADGLAGQPLATLIAVVTLVLLCAALLASVGDALAKARENRLSHSLDRAQGDLRVATEELRRRAFEDPLTGLPNRALFEDRLQHAVARVGRQMHDPNAGGALVSDHIAVMCLNLDGFKPINDSFGHAAGDEVLREVGLRLAQSVRESDTLARLAGDEFVVMVESRGATSAGLALAQRMLAAMARPVRIGELPVALSCSIGIAIYPDHDDGHLRLLSCAELAMTAAKRAGGGTVVVYDQSMQDNSSEQVILQQDLRMAVERGELQLHYQPKVVADSNEVHGLEALLRWRHPQRGLVSPALFVPLAERFGLIGSIGNWVIDEACAQLARWHASGLRCRVAINLSPYQLRHPDLPARIRNALERNGLDASQLVCEITESAMMENMNAERAVLDQIAHMGVRLSIDDFGTGYSSLAHLRNIPARQIKIDRSFEIGRAHV